MYEEDVERMGYVAPKLASECLYRWAQNPDARILDVGCGTGLVGLELQRMGYTNIDGLDASKEMLAKAERKGVYDRLICADIGESLFSAVEVELDLYDALMCVGIFTHGYVRADALECMVELVRPGGYMCFTVHEGGQEAYDFKSTLIDLEDRKVWKTWYRSKLDFLSNENIQAWYYVYRVLQHTFGKRIPWEADVPTIFDEVEISQVCQELVAT
jgi:2-polyprenyl-3-methyl-5-hydroxy-6-metoxy-1,4-benzoquinol methylase